MLNKYAFIIIPLFCLLNGITPAKATTVIHAAGATFPYPLYTWWALRHGRLNDFKLEYNPTGSGGGIRRIEQNLVDFGASDAPLSQAKLDQYGLIQFPTVLGGVVPVIYIPGIKTAELMLTGPILADIFLGKITRWNDPVLVQINPNLTLPNLPISIVHRTKGSGTTWIFTNYLNKVSPVWSDKFGVNKLINWPVGHAAIGNNGVIQQVQQTPGSIGYAEYAYVMQSDVDYALLKNHDGYFVKPTTQNFKAAARFVNWSEKGADIVLTNQPGKKTWPIVGATFIIMYKLQSNPVIAQKILSFFNWCYQDGDLFSENLDYVTLSPEVKDHIRDIWHQELHDLQGQPVWPITPLQD
ncbi:MAG: phosphate ABC transporter substrate-binding protein PstS [Mariprofundaceae bacterium]|nr:phosphate ABC transporter substrate-binding protein PstS [Mariprofundaceae bacterium]